MAGGLLACSRRPRTADQPERERNSIMRARMILIAIAAALLPVRAIADTFVTSAVISSGSVRWGVGGELGNFQFSGKTESLADIFLEGNVTGESSPSMLTAREIVTFNVPL